jgi:hypothetical protein
MKMLAQWALAVLLAGASACAPTAGLVQPAGTVLLGSTKNVSGVVKSYDSGTGALTLDDGTSYTVPNDPAHQLPAGFTGAPEVGQAVQITYGTAGGQRIVRDLEPQSRGHSG